MLWRLRSTWSNGLVSNAGVGFASIVVLDIAMLVSTTRLVVNFMLLGTMGC